MWCVRWQSLDLEVAFPAVFVGFPFPWLLSSWRAPDWFLPLGLLAKIECLYFSSFKCSDQVWWFLTAVAGVWNSSGNGTAAMLPPLGGQVSSYLRGTVIRVIPFWNWTHWSVVLAADGDEPEFGSVIVPPACSIAYCFCSWVS